MNTSLPAHADSRRKLLLAALRLFAAKGYEGATTREICDAAGANLSAIRYYFGDKGGLYRAAFCEPLGEEPDPALLRGLLELPLPQAFSMFFREFLQPLERGEEVRLVMKLHFREMIEPTGIWQQEIDTEIRPQHELMVAMLVKTLDLTAPDADVQRLAIAIVAMAVHFYVGFDVIDVLAPEVLSSPDAIETLSQRLTGYALSMVEGERQRREAACS
ncbi:CerR family C-terminal domain-containing protein [Methyloversatilis thermotolerans]|uniref:CerR family C-terminal domain-containing protein n=1 Tax=Methyloversatilis thermotolerans TaxID=1346290 RepID=UPI00035D2488|nr:CerR family C-terminal domain-containing protein [Methyloversatilis thermotolerans]